MPGVLSDELKAYFEEARRWDQDAKASALRSRRRAWIVAGFACAIALASIGAVFTLLPLKTVEPFVVRVDQTTGAVAVMSGLTGSSDVTYDEAVSKYFLAMYVRHREGYLDAAREENFRQVSILSTPDEQRRWADLYRGTNPDSPQNLYGRDAEAIVAIRAISFINPQVANIRFHRTVRSGTQVVESDWIATVAFAYSKAPMLESDRLRNPLGFQVRSYRADPEVVR